MDHNRSALQGFGLTAIALAAVYLLLQAGRVGGGWGFVAIAAVAVFLLYRSTSSVSLPQEGAEHVRRGDRQFFALLVGLVVLFALFRLA